MKQRKNNRGGRFTTIENEREQQRKIYEDNLRKKKEQLYFEFEKQEEVLKYTKISVDSHNDVQFKYEHDKVINYRIAKENELQNLHKKLNDIIEVNKEQEPLPEGQSLFFSGNKGTNLTSIFSKSYYRSSGLQIMSSSQQNSREDVHNYISYLQNEVNSVQENLVNEEQRTKQLTSSMHELFKTKQKFKDELHDLEFLNDTADRRFHGLAAVQFKAKEKKTAIEKDLNSVKKTLKEYQQIGEKYKEKQMIKMKQGEKIKKTAEEIISHEMIRQDELERENQILLRQIQQQAMEQQNIIDKRSETRYILKYIDCFTTFERLFLDGPPKKDEIEELYEISLLNNRNTHFQTVRQDSDNCASANMLSNRQIQGGGGNQQPKMHSTLSSTDSRCPNTPDHLRSSFNISEEENRIALIDKIDKFYNDHPNGGEYLIEEMIKMFNNYSYIQEGLNKNHSRLLQEKASKQQEFLDLELNLSSIKQANLYLEEMDKNPQFEKEMLSIPESLDSGLLTIPKIFQDQSINTHSTNHNDNNNTDNKIISTLNIIKSGNFSSENEKIKENIQKNYNFVFNFFSNYCESAIRMCQVLEFIYQFSYNLCPIQIDSLAQSIIQFIKDIWAGKFDENTESFSKIGKKKRQTTIQKIGTQELLNGEEQNIAYFKHIQSEKFSNEEITQTFLDIYPNSKHEAERFFNLIKSERIIWFFCNIDQIRNFLIEQKRLNGQNKGLIKVFDNIEDLKQQGIKVFDNKIQNLMELMVKLQLKVKECGKTCLNIIRDTYPDFNQKRRFVNKNIRESEEIREAKLKATIKSDNYFRNNDPLMEDFIILSKEEDYNKVILDSDNLSLEQQKQNKSEAKNQDQINKLIEYIKNSKNNGQQILQEQKKQQVQQAQKKKKNAKNQQYSQDSSQSNQFISSHDKNNIGETNNSIPDPSNHPAYHRGSNQSLNLADMKDKKYNNNQDYGSSYSIQQQNQSSQQQQQSNQSNQMNSNQDSYDGRVTKFYLNGQNKEDIYRFKQLNKAENLMIGQERERIHNLSKQKQLQEQIEIQNQLMQKNNKFFISNHISEINDRLVSENHAPFKEKLIRNFSESQLVLSKVDRMDRFSGFIGPTVLEKIQDEKSQMIRNLRGELYEPDLNYLKSNSTYNIRKNVAQQQLNYLHDLKLQQTVQLNQSHSQLIQNSANKNPHQHSYMQDSSMKINQKDKQKSPSPDGKEMKQDQNSEFNVQLSHFHPMNPHFIEKTQMNSQKRTQETEEKNQQKNMLNSKMKEIKTVLKLPSAQSMREQLPDTRPQTQGSNTRSKIQENMFKGLSLSNNKNGQPFNSSGSNFYSTKILRNAPLSSNNNNDNNNNYKNKRINTPLSHNITGLNDILSSENSLMFNTSTNQKSQIGPYNDSNLKFYQRYASPEGDAFFDYILNGPLFPASTSARPKTQLQNSRQNKDSNNNNNPSNMNQQLLSNYNFPPSQQTKPQSSHEGKRNLFYQSQEQMPMKNKNKQNELQNDNRGSEYMQNNNNKIVGHYQQNQKQQQYQQQDEVEERYETIGGENENQQNQNKFNDLHSTLSYSSSRTAYTSNRPNQTNNNNNNYYYQNQNNNLAKNNQN